MKHPISTVTREEAAASGSERWWRIGSPAGPICSVQIIWHDGTTAFDAPVFYTSNWNDPTEPADGAAAPDLTMWSLESGVTGTAVTASAAGSQMYHLGNNGAKWVLVKVNPTAASVFSIRAHSKD